MPPEPIRASTRYRPPSTDALIPRSLPQSPIRYASSTCFGDRRGDLAARRLVPEVAAVQDDNRDRDRGDVVGRPAGANAVNHAFGSVRSRRAAPCRSCRRPRTREPAPRCRCPTRDHADHHGPHRPRWSAVDRRSRTARDRTPGSRAPAGRGSRVTSRGVHHRAAVRDRGGDERHLQRVRPGRCPGRSRRCHERLVRPRSSRRRGSVPVANGSDERDRRLEARGLVGRIGRAEPVRVRLLGEPVGAELQADLAEDHVARVRERGSAA